MVTVREGDLNQPLQQRIGLNDSLRMIDQPRQHLLIVRGAQVDDAIKLKCVLFARARLYKQDAAPLMVHDPLHPTRHPPAD